MTGRQASLAFILFLLATCRAPADEVARYHVAPQWDAPIVGVSLLTIIVPNLDAAHLIQPRCPCDPSEVNALDRGVIGHHSVAADTLSDITLGVAELAPIALDAADVGLTAVLRDDMIVYAETLSVSGAFATIAKYAAQRPLPRVYAGQAPELINEPGGYRSFYSGHTTSTFAALTASSFTLGMRHGARVWPWIVTGVLGTSVALERVAAGRHFYTDVAVGAAAGFAVGYLVPWWHSSHPGETPPVALEPIEGGVRLSWTRTF